MKEITDRRYPIGQFEYGKTYSIEETRKHIKSIARLPKDIKKTFKKLRDGALDKTYRPGGWTARQVIHHIADSHINAYIRFKLAATEDAPIIKPYEEKLWAETEDGKHGSPKTSLKILNALHIRWIEFIASLSDDDLDRGYYHPASKRTFSLREAIALYAWHGRHHLAHIKIVADGKGVSTEKASKNTAEEKAPKGQKAAEPKAASTETGKKKRTLSPEHKAKITAAQQARRAAERAAKPVTATEPAKRGRKAIQQQIQSENQKAQAQRAAQPIAAPKGAAPEKPARRSSAEVAAEKAAKAAAPKLTREEVMAKARAAAAANRAAKAADAPKKAASEKPARAPRRSSAEVAAEKAAKAAMPKLSRKEVMAKARAAAAANRAAKGKSAAKPQKDPNAPKLSREEALAKARAARTKKE